jgi:ankyrin repeat protein
MIGNGFTIDQTGILSLIYIISNNFPSESQSEEIYQLLNTQRSFIPNVLQVLKGPSADSILENLFKLAVEAEDLPIVKDLIKAGANVNANNCTLRYAPVSWKPLQFACWKGNIPLVQELITAGSDVDAPQSGGKFSAILLAIYGHDQSFNWGNIQQRETESLFHLVQILFDEGASVNAVDIRTNYTMKPPIHWMHKIFAEHSPLTLASKLRYKEIVNFLILKGADVQFRMNGNISALRISLYSMVSSKRKPMILSERFHFGKSEIRSTIVSIAHRLMRAGAELNDHLPCNFTELCKHYCLECYSVLDLAILVGSTKLIDLMLYSGAKTTHHSLDLALQVENFEIFSKLLDKGAAIPNWASSRTQDETSPFFNNEGPRNVEDIHLQETRALVLAAIHLGAISELECLIRSVDGSTINLLDGCTGLTTALEHCCRSGHSETLQCLLEAGIISKALPVAVYGRSILFSIRHNRRVVLDLLLENGADVDAGDAEFERFEVPVLVAIEKGDVELVRKLIRAGAKLDYEQSCRRTCNDQESCDDQERLGSMLVAAIQAGNLAVTEEILGERININGTAAYSLNFMTKECCCSPITMAIMKRNWTLVDRLRRGGATLNSTSQNLDVVDYYTPLWAAVYQENFELVKSLIEAGAEVNDRMALKEAIHNDELLEFFVTKMAKSTTLRRECNALHFALQKLMGEDNIPKVELILKSQLVDLAAVECGGIFWEALTSKYEVRYTLLHMLLAAGADPKSLVSKNKTALLCAIGRNDMKSVQMMLEADVLGSAGLRPEMYHSPAQEAAQASGLEVLQLLLTYGFDPNDVGSEGQNRDCVSVGSAIQYATEKKNFEMVRILLAHSANPDAITKTNSHTALQIASRDGNLGIAELLLRNGADVNSPPAEKFGATALQFAALGGYLGIASLLIEKGADINAPPGKIDGRTALEAAAEHGRIDMVQLLKSSGADISGEEDGQYTRALARAFNNGHHATWRLLLSYSSS